MHFLYLFILQSFFATLHVSDDYFVHHQEFINLLYLQLCTQLQNTVNHKLLMMNEMVVRNMESCTKIVE